MAFGQHQTFYLRLQWLYKGLSEIEKNPGFFREPDHFVDLGVGKNMAQSIRHWLQATKVAEPNSRRTELYVTDLGRTILDNDPYLQRSFSIALLHNELVRDRDLATTWYWFFNVFDERVFSKELVQAALLKWVEESEYKVSKNSLKRDVDCLFALYLPKEYKNQTPEDIFKSPFEELKVIGKTAGNNYVKKSVDIENIIDVLFITLVQYMVENMQTEVSLNELINGENLWGRVFNLTRNDIIEAIEMIQIREYPLAFTRTNRLDVIHLNDENENRTHIDWMKNVYAKEVVKR